MKASIKTAEQIEKMRVAGRLAAETLEMIAPYVAPGITTGELDRIASANVVNRSFIGMGYYDTKTPSVILRNVLVGEELETVREAYEVLVDDRCFWISSWCTPAWFWVWLWF